MLCKKNAIQKLLSESPNDFANDAQNLILLMIYKRFWGEPTEANL